MITMSRGFSVIGLFTVSLLSSLDNNEFIGSGCCWIDLTAQHKLALMSLTYIIAHVSTLSAATASGKNFNVIPIYWSCILSHAWDTLCTREVPSLQCSVIVGWRKTLDLSFYFPTPKALYSFLKSTTPSVDTSQSTQRKKFVLNGGHFTAFISWYVHLAINFVSAVSS